MHHSSADVLFLLRGDSIVDKSAELPSALDMYQLFCHAVRFEGCTIEETSHGRLFGGPTFRQCPLTNNLQRRME